MKTLVLTNQKGGVGKSTIAVHAAWFLAERGRVLFIDLDGQRNATRSLAPHQGKTSAISLFQGEQAIPAAGLITLAYATTDLPEIEAEGQDILDTFRRTSPPLRRSTISASSTRRRPGACGHWPESWWPTPSSARFR